MLIPTPSLLADALPKLPPHLDLIVLSAIGFWLLSFLSSAISPRVSSTYRSLPLASKNSWNFKVVSTTHCFLVLPLAYGLLNEPHLVRDKVFGYSFTAGQVYAVSVGFIFDTYFSIVHSTIGMVVHGVACLFVYSGSYRPFLSYFGCRFLLWELSTPFLNIHWFLEKTGRSGSPFMIVNAVLLMAVFFGCRIIYGTSMSLEFATAMYDHRDRVPLALQVAYGLGNLALNGLNYFWFFKMCQGMARRLKGERKPKANGHAKAH